MFQRSRMPPDPIQARHLAWLEEVGTMTMSLARQAHTRATAELADPEPPAPGAKDQTRRFTDLVRCVRQLVAAEARIAAGPANRRLPFRRPAAADPRHALLRQTLHRAVRHDPDGASLRRAVDQELDAEITADPDRRRPAGNLLVAIADRLAIPLDVAILPDELLPDDEDDEPDASRSDPKPALLTPCPKQNPSSSAKVPPPNASNSSTPTVTASSPGPPAPAKRSPFRS